MTYANQAVSFLPDWIQMADKPLQHIIFSTSWVIDLSTIFYIRVHCELSVCTSADLC